MEKVKTLNLHKYGADHPVSFELARYVENDNMYVGVLTHESGYPEPWSALTVNLSVKCPPSCAFIDTNNNGVEIIGWLKENGLAKETGITLPSGFCTYPMVQFNMEKLFEYCDRKSIQEFRENDVKPKHVFVAPENDLEAHTILGKLISYGYEKDVNLFVTRQGWGATWENLEPEIKDALSAIAKEGSKTIYGVELAGKNPYGAKNIDHHSYEGDDRSNPLSSLEQVAQVLGDQLDETDRFIAANDKGYIPAMWQLADELGYSLEERDQMVSDVRRTDRAVQGVSKEQEEQAAEAIQHLEHKNGYDLVYLPHSKCSPVTDTLFGKYDNLLIVCGDGERDFYGDGRVCAKLQEELGGWSGGSKDSGFWGGYVDEQNITSILNDMLGEPDLSCDER